MHVLVLDGEAFSTGEKVNMSLRRSRTVLDGGGELNVLATLPPLKVYPVTIGSPLRPRLYPSQKKEYVVPAETRELRFIFCWRCVDSRDKLMHCLVDAKVKVPYGVGRHKW
jgi:hypothetical protein